MKNKKSILGLALVVAVLVLGVGYAVVGERYLTITGSAGSTPLDTNFNVHFDYDSETDGNNTLTGSITPTIDQATATGTYTGDKTATFSISGLHTAGDSGYVEYTIVNDSNSIIADLEVQVCASVSDNQCVDAKIGGKLNNFTITTDYDASLPSTDGSNTTTLKVIATLDKTPTNVDLTDTFTILLTAKPQNVANSAN